MPQVSQLIEDLLVENLTAPQKQALLDYLNSEGYLTLQSSLSSKQNVLTEGAFVDGDKTALDEAIAKQTTLANIPSVADAITRKNPATYTDIQVGFTRVIQADQIGVLWTLVDADVSLDASWIGQPYTVDPDGNILVSMELADVTGTVPDIGVLGRVGNRLVIGDGVLVGGAKATTTDPTGKEQASKLGAVLMESLWRAFGYSGSTGCAFFTTTYAGYSGTTSAQITVKTTTGYARPINSDGSLGAQVGTGSPTSNITVPFARGAYLRANGVMPVSNGGSTRSGGIVSIFVSITNYNIHSFYAHGGSLTDLVELNVQNSKLTSLTLYQGFNFLLDGLNIDDSELDAEALNALYTSLGAGTGNIVVGGNPGASTADHSIAEAKGYTIIAT